MSGDFAGDLGLIPGQGTRSHMLQLGVYMPQLGPGAPNTLKKNIYIYICVCVCVCVCVCMCLENDLTKGENLFYISIPAPGCLGGEGRRGGNWSCPES